MKLNMGQCGKSEFSQWCRHAGETFRKTASKHVENDQSLNKYVNTLQGYTECCKIALVY